MGRENTHNAFRTGRTVDPRPTIAIKGIIVLALVPVETALVAHCLSLFVCGGGGGGGGGGGRVRGTKLSIS